MAFVHKQVMHQPLLGLLVFENQYSRQAQLLCPATEEG